jgi:hypothetical protein
VKGGLRKVAKNRKRNGGPRRGRAEPWVNAPARLDVAREVLAAAPRRIALLFRPDACIAATRVAVSCLRAFGVPAEPVPVSVVIFNPPYLARVRAGGAVATREEIVALFDVDGSWTVGVGTPGEERPGRYAGHLVAGFPAAGRYWVMDLSLGQANRPQYGINLGPQLVGLPADFTAGRGRSWGVINGSAVGYAPAPEATGYLASPDWVRRERTVSIIAEVREQVEYRLGERGHAPGVPAGPDGESVRQTPRTPGRAS